MTSVLIRTTIRHSGTGASLDIDVILGHIHDRACKDVNYTWAPYQIRKIADAHAPGMPGTFSPQPRVSDPDMHHGSCVTHAP